MRSFKFRSRVGHDVAVEALREAIRTHEATPAEVVQWARVDRVGAVVRPTSKRCSDAEAGHQHRRIGSAAAAQPGARARAESFRPAPPVLRHRALSRPLGQDAMG